LTSGFNLITYLIQNKSCGWVEENPEKGREAATPSLIKEIQEVQWGQEAPHNGGAIIPKDA
jgi:hypothetical protein